MRPFLALTLILVAIIPAGASLWDYDTLRREPAARAAARELIVGKFLRHSDAFYEWRIEDRSAKIAADDAGKITLSDKELAAAYDDWAVALDKLGRYSQAIAVIDEKAKRIPGVGAYRTRANRGTFLIHAGKLDAGLAELREAVANHPQGGDAREQYHILLVAYRIARQNQAEQISLPLDDSPRNHGGPFAQWVLEKKGLAGSHDEAAIAKELDRARTGLMGIMYFGDHESPLLLEALGDLLLAPNSLENGRRLAARAYLRAAANVSDTSASKAYYQMAREAISGDSLTLRRLEDQLAREMKESSEWFGHVVADEKLWVAKSTDPNPDERFWQKYGQRQISLGDVHLPPAHYTKRGLPWQIQVALAAVGVSMIGLVLGLLAWRRRRPTGYE